MNKDQKHLELLYEQVVGNSSFQLLKQEEALFEEVASMITKEAWRVLKSTGDVNQFSYESLSQIVNNLSDKLNPNQLLAKYFPAEVVSEAGWVYFVGVIYYLTKNKIFLKRHYEPEDAMFFEFETVGRSLNVIRRVNVNDKERFKQSLKEWFVSQLEYLHPTFAHDYSTWAKWKLSELKSKELDKQLSPDFEVDVLKDF